MSRQMIEIEPGTESWDAWIEYHRGTKAELVMVNCRHNARPFYAWSAMPPERVKHDQILSGNIVVDSAGTATLPARRVVADGEVEAIADRLLAKAERDEAEAAAMEERQDDQAKLTLLFEKAAQAVQSGNKPKLKDLPDIGMTMIEDPMEVQQGRKPKPRRAKLVNLRDDPIGQMAKRKQIVAEQLEAARKWQALHDTAASIGGSRGIDPSAMKVDGGRFGEPINDVQMYAIKKLQDVDGVLGAVGASIVRRVLGERMTVSQVAAMMNKASEQGQRHTGDRLRECLDTLVVVMGVEVEGKVVRAPRDAASDLSRYADNPLLYQAVHAARSKIV